MSEGKRDKGKAKAKNRARSGKAGKAEEPRAEDVGAIADIPGAKPPAEEPRAEDVSAIADMSGANPPTEEPRAEDVGGIADIPGANPPAEEPRAEDVSAIADMSSANPPAEEPRDVADGVYFAVPEEPDPPSYAPIFTGLGIAVTAWGFLTSPAILALGMLIFCSGMLIWIKELTTHEH